MTASESRIEPEPTPLGKDDGPLNHVLELPDITGPVVLPEGRDILAR